MKLARPAALVLCGGASRRMGQPKAWLRFGSEFLLQRVVRLVATRADPVLVVAAAGQELPPLTPSVRVVRDSVSDQGPLRGVATGLAALADEVDLVYVTATDVPLLQPQWITCLVHQIGDADLMLPEVGGRLQPLAALYRRAPVLAAANALLNADSRRLIDLTERVRTLIASESCLRDADPMLATVRNINTPACYRQLLAELERAAEPGE